MADKISFKTLALAQKFSEQMVGGLFDNFSETQTYQKGELVLYNHILYQFTQNKSAGAWDSSKVSQVQLDNLVENINKNSYFNVSISDIQTMGDLRNYIDGVNQEGKHCFFDMHDYIDDGYVCTINMFTKDNKNYCHIYNVLKQKTIIDFNGYQDSTLVSTYCNNAINSSLIVIPITDVNTTMGDMKTMLDNINDLGYTVVFNVSSLGASMYMASVLIVNDNVIISDWLDNYMRFEGTYNANELLVNCLENMKADIYGVKRTIGSSSSIWERTDKGVGKVANATKDGTAVVNDFDYIYPWNEIKSVNMNNDGTINAEYGDDNFKFDGTNGDVMTRIPRFYYRRYQENGYEYIKISRYALEGYIESPEFYIGRYHTITGAKSNNSARPQVSTTITDFRNQAKAKGNKWQQLDYHYFLLQMLYLVEYADYNSQSKLGEGVSSIRYVATDTAILDETNTNRIVIATDNSAYEVGTYISIGTSQGSYNRADTRMITEKKTEDGGTAIYFDGDPINITVGNVLWGSAQIEGQCDELGMLSGTLNNNGHHSCIYRGIENPFGNVYQFVDGLNIKDNVAYINYNPLTYQVDKFDGDYTQLSYVNANANGYGKKLGYDSNNPIVALDTEIGGSTTTYLCDYYYQATGNRIACVGGRFNGGGYVGLWYWSLDIGSGAATVYIGSRLLKTI